MSFKVLRLRMSLKKRKSSQSSTSAQTGIRLPSGEYLPFEEVFRENYTVKEVTEQVCDKLGLLPVTWSFFGLCPVDSNLFLNPYATLTAADGAKVFRFRVIVNVNPNYFHLKFLHEKALNIFFDQVHGDFLNDRLNGILTDHALWMAGVDMARRALEEKTDFRGLLQKYNPTEFCPPSFTRKFQQLKRVVTTVFNKFYENHDTSMSSDKLKLKYLEIAEKSELIEFQTFQASVSSADATPVPGLLRLSARGGIQLESPANGPKIVCSLSDIKSIECTVSGSCEPVAKLKTTDNQDYLLTFKRPEELVCLAVSTDILYSLLVNCNTSILIGELKIPERFLKITEREEVPGSYGYSDTRYPVNHQLCHGPISREAVYKVLNEHGLSDGLYLVRRSRQRVRSYTLHVCYLNKVRNFEIKMTDEGQLYILQSHPFESMLRLVYYYHRHRHGLPTVLQKIVPPGKTDPIPLLSKDPINDLATEAAHSDKQSIREDEDFNSGGSGSSSAGVPNSPMSPQEDFSSSASPYKLDLKKFPFPWLKIEKKLGEGHFSNVYFGILTDDDQQIQMRVAVKVLKSSKESFAKEELEKEAKSMAKLKHDHIVKFLGVSQGPAPVSGEVTDMLITEFVALGDLRSFLRKFHKTPDSIKQEELVSFSVQIADGMDYLQREQIVHRDLAARNVLVDSNRKMKISDFGLARQLNLQENSDYYRLRDTNAALPLWWYAPEAINEWKFTHANDVWSFGVTVWEIFSFGATPKGDKIAFGDRMDIHRWLTSGKRLNRPNYCPESVYTIIRDLCWNIDPNKRPSFSELSGKLSFGVF